ncbi:MAG: FHA domain-containing protein [Anaerolineales bacterium]|nr:FHA domain-containing protein [Anaerolineales bacterium]
MKRKTLVFIWQWVGAALLAALLFPLLLHAAGETAVSPPPHFTTAATDEAAQLTLHSLIGPFYKKDDDIKKRELYFPSDQPQITLTLASAEYAVTNLAKADINTVPAHLLLLVDNSGSMEPLLTKPAEGRSTLDQVGGDVVDGLGNSSELNFAVWSFNKAIQPHLSFTSNRDHVKKELAAVKPTADRPTCLYDMLTTAVSAIETFTSSRHRGGIILFTDGRDERTRNEGSTPCSQKARLEEAIAVARDAFIPIHVVLLTGKANANQKEMEHLTNETGGQLIVPDNGEKSAQLAKILAPFKEQWIIQTDVYTPAGPQEGILSIYGKNGDLIDEYAVRFTAPRAFPAPATLTPADADCEGSLDKEFEFALDDDYDQVAFATVQVRENNSPDFVTPALVIGDPNHLVPQDGKITFLLNSNHNWTARTNYTLQLSPYDNQNKPLTELQRTCTLRIPPPIPTLRIEPDSRQVAITDSNFTVDLNVENGSDRWQTLDVYVRHERGWWSPTAELYHYTCPSPYTANDSTASVETLCELAGSQVEAVKDNKTEKPVAETIITTTTDKFKLTVPHEARRYSFEVILQARDQDGHGLLAEPLPYMTGLNWLGLLRERWVNFWETTIQANFYLSYGLLCLVLPLLGVLVNMVWQAWRQKGPKIIDDQDFKPLPTRAKLIVVRSADKRKEGHFMTLGKSPVRVGRGENCALSLPGDGYLSREHIEIQWDNGRYKLIDCKSDNGTKIQVVVGQQAKPEQVVASGGFVQLTATASRDSNEVQYTHIYVGETVLRLEEEYI